MLFHDDALSFSVRRHHAKKIPHKIGITAGSSNEKAPIATIFLIT